MLSKVCYTSPPVFLESDSDKPSEIVRTLRLILMESFILFSVEVVWECILSWIVLRYNIKINYTRKLGNLLKVPKYFVTDFFPQYTSTALSMVAFHH